MRGLVYTSMLIIIFSACEEPKENTIAANHRWPGDSILVPYIDSFSQDWEAPSHTDDMIYIFSDFEPDLPGCDNVWIESITYTDGLGTDSIEFLIQDTDISFPMKVGYRHTDSLTGAKVYLRHNGSAVWVLNSNFGLDSEPVSVEPVPPCGAPDGFWWFEFRIWDSAQSIYPDSMDVIYNWAYDGGTVFWWDRDVFRLSHSYSP